MRIFKSIAAPLLILGVTACSSTPVELPNNVTANGRIIDSIDTSFAYQGSDKSTFKKLQFCVADIMSNKSVELKGTSSHFGSYTGNLYTYESTSVAEGGDLFKFVDEDSYRMVIEGSYDYMESVLGMPEPKNFKYKLIVKLQDGNANLTYSELGRASKKTEIVSNQGYYPIYTHSMANPIEFVRLVEDQTVKVEQCYGNL